MEDTRTSGLTHLFEGSREDSVIHIEPLPPSGSSREYFRIQGEKGTAIGAYNLDRRENHAFVSLSQHFKEKGLAVPEVYAADLDNHIYLVEDLGDQTLFGFLVEKRTNGVFPEELRNPYKKALEGLARFQVQGAQDLDYSVCYPRASFDRQSMLWDLNYFKYYFLKLVKAPFDEQLLEEDFHTFSEYLLQANCDYFLYRDFQARNIMLVGEEPYFIDYQGGRKGALQYDLASILYQARADIPQNLRDELLDHYLHSLGQHIKVEEESFTQFYYGYVIMRLIQVLGAYGFRGFYERKAHFLESIPFAIENLRTILGKISFPVQIPSLMAALEHICDSETVRKLSPNLVKKEGLLVKISSFSYKRGLPEDHSSHGGGFVFDCRSIHNPGRYNQYKKLTGRDQEVIQFFKEDGEIDLFFGDSAAMVDRAVEKYISRKFNYLSVNYGCTGGQHRSVYCADKMAEHLQAKYGVEVEVFHREQERKGWKNG